LKKILAENKGKKDTRKLERKIKEMEEANERALFIRDKIDCEDKPEVPEPAPEPEPEPEPEAPKPTKIEGVRKRIA